MRFAVSAFGLAMLVTQLGVPAIAQSQNEAPSPVYAWPVGQTGGAGDRSWGSQGYQGFSPQAPVHVAGLPFHRIGSGWQPQSRGGYQYCPPGAAPMYPPMQPQLAPPIQAPQMAPGVPMMPGTPMAPGVPMTPGAPMTPGVPAPGQIAPPMGAAPGAMPPAMTPEGQPQPGLGQPAPQDTGLAPPVTQPEAAQPLDAPQPTDAQLDAFASADAPSSDFEGGAATGTQALPINMVGDNFGITTTASPLRFTLRAPNSEIFSFLSGGPGDLNSVILFDANPISGADAQTLGPGAHRFGQAVFSLDESSLSNVLEGPDDPCFRFAEGTATNDDPSGFTGPWDIEVVYECDQENNIITTAGSNVGRIKTAEDVSPIPRDRFFFNYSLFTGVPLAPDGISVNRFTPGMEEAFLDERMSVEVRLPMAVTRNSNFDLDNIDISEWEFGDVYVAFKHLFYQCHNRYLSAGLSVSIPTGRDSTVSMGNQLITRINNRSYRVAPFIGGLVHNDLFFAQGFVQVDVDVSGDDVMHDDDMNGILERAGVLQDPTLIYFDLQLGAWLLRDTDPHSSRLLTGLASIFEIHYNRSVNDLDTVNVPANFGSPVAGFFTLGNPDANIDVLNLMAGGVLDFRGRSSVSVTYAVPVTEDKQFDGELRVLFNRFL